MKKVETDKATIFQLLSIPILFVQYLFSFVLAVSLRLMFKPEATQSRELPPNKLDEDKVDPQLMGIVRGLESPAQVTQS